MARAIIGLGLKAAQKLLFPGLSEDDKPFFTRFHLAYRRHYDAGEAGVPLYEGAYELVRDLVGAGRVVAVATAKSRQGINRSLQVTGLDQFIRHTRTPEECRPKPDPQMIDELLAESKTARESAVMVGDTTHDLKMAVNARVACVGICHGAHAEGELLSVNPLAVVPDIAKLRLLLL